MNKVTGRTDVVRAQGTSLTANEIWVLRERRQDDVISVWSWLEQEFCQQMAVCRRRVTASSSWMPMAGDVCCTQLESRITAVLVSRSNILSIVPLHTLSIHSTYSVLWHSLEHSEQVIITISTSDEFYTRQKRTPQNLIIRIPITITRRVSSNTVHETSFQDRFPPFKETKFSRNATRTLSFQYSANESNQRVVDAVLSFARREHQRFSAYIDSRCPNCWLFTADFALHRWKRGQTECFSRLRIRKILSLRAISRSSTVVLTCSVCMTSREKLDNKSPYFRQSYGISLRIANSNVLEPDITGTYLERSIQYRQSYNKSEPFPRSRQRVRHNSLLTRSRDAAESRRESDRFYSIID